MARLRDEMLARVESLSGAPSMLKSDDRSETYLGGTGFGVAPIAQDTAGPGFRSVVDGFDSPSEVACYAALLLKLNFPAAALRQMVLSFGRSFFSKLLADAGGSSKEDDRYPLGNSVDNEMRCLNNSFLPRFVDFSKRFRLLFVDAVSMTNSGVFSNDVPTNEKLSESEGSLGAEHNTAAGEMVSLAEELGFAYLASATRLLGGFGDGDSYEVEVRAAKVQGSTPVRFRAMVEAIQQIIEAVGSLEGVVEPMRCIRSAFVAKSKSLSPTAGSGPSGIKEKASAIVE